METITKTENNLVVVKKTETKEITETEEFDQEKIDIEKERIPKEIKRLQDRLKKLDLIQEEMNKEL